MQVARYKEVLLKCALNLEVPHVLMQHFASATLTTLVERNAINLNEGECAALKVVNVSPFLPEEDRYDRDNSYSANSKEYKKPKKEFRFDYDFRKLEADNLGRLFGQHTWAICNSIADTVRSIDPTVSSMDDSGGRGQSQRWHDRRTEDQVYGEYLAWHSLFIVAGTLLKTKKIHKYWTNDETPWNSWFEAFSLTRSDGYWLSDGTDQIPTNLIQNLLEESAGKVVLTGDKEKLHNLVFVSEQEVKEIAIYGSWDSFDEVSVGISSALFQPEIVTKAIAKLLKEKPFHVGLPFHDVYQYGELQDIEGIPLVALPNYSSGLDGSDPYGSSYAGARARLRDDYSEKLGLVRSEVHGRAWRDQDGQVSTRSEVWGSNHSYGGDDPEKGQRLLISFKTLSTLLRDTNLELLILIRLYRYEKGWGRENSKYTHTIGVIHINGELEHKLHLGHINHTESLS